MPVRPAICALVLSCATLACDGRATPKPRPDAGVPGPRTVKPAPDDVRVYPPHAIRSDGVGPYLLDAPLADAAHIAPEGPRIEILELGNLLRWRMVRAEDGRLLIGADERSRVAFIVVLAADIARTDGGMTVGMSGAALLAAFGPARDDGDVVRARRVYQFEKLPNVRFLTDDPPTLADKDTRVIAVLVQRPGAGGGAAPEPPARPDRGLSGAVAAAARPAHCRTGGELAAVTPAELAAAPPVGRARPGAVAAAGAPAPTVRWACVSSGDAEALVVSGSELAIVGGAPGKLRRLATLALGSIDQVAPLDIDGDGRDEIVALTTLLDEDRLAMLVRVWTWEGGRLVPSVSQRVLEVTREQAATAGVKPSAIDLWVEIRPAGGALLVGGLYVARTPAGARAIAPVEPVRVRLDTRRGSPATPEATDGGTAAPPHAPHDADAGAGRSPVVPAAPTRDRDTRDAPAERPPQDQDVGAGANGAAAGSGGDAKDRP